MIIETLREAYPGHRILAEESGETDGTAGKHDADYQWIIDPLGGTTNFIHGFPAVRDLGALAGMEFSIRRWSSTLTATSCLPPARAAAPPERAPDSRFKRSSPVQESFDRHWLFIATSPYVDAYLGLM